MPTFDDTWILSKPCIPSISSQDHLDTFSSNAELCCLCGDDLHIDEPLTATPPRPPGDAISCAQCTWLQRNRHSTCHRCATRFVCPSPPQLHLSSMADHLPTSSHRLVATDEAYDGDDECGAISNFRTLSVSRLKISTQKKKDRFVAAAMTDGCERGSFAFHKRDLAAAVLKGGLVKERRGGCSNVEEKTRGDGVELANGGMGSAVLEHGG